MYLPKFTITNEILSNIGLIEAAKEVIENAPLIPVYEARFVKDAILRSVHHGTHIEGNDLSLNEARKVIEGENLVGRERDIQEVINYRKVIDYIDELVPQKHLPGAKAHPEGVSKNTPFLSYIPTMLRKINSIACDRLVAGGRTGEFRKTQVILRDSRTNEIVFRPPPAVEVEFLLEDYFDWINSATGRQVHPVLRAGISHYYLVAVHPFIEANGRTARAFTSLILYAEKYDIKRFFSIEEYFDKDAARYYQALMSVDRKSGDLDKRDLTIWLEYFTQAMGVELTRVKEKVKKLSIDLKMKGKIGYPIPLNERQMKLMEYLQEHGAMTTSEARKVAPQYSDDTLVRDFLYFLKKGIVKKEGKTKAAVYKIK